MSKDIIAAAETPAASPAAEQVQAAAPFKRVTGSANTPWSANLLNRTRGTMADLPVKGRTPEDEAGAVMNLVIDSVAAFEPKDPVEGMIASQAVALHHASMECLRRAMIPEQPAEIAAKLRKDGANLGRGFTDMLDALARHRGKGPQVVRVERVVVQDGGQAIVGSVATGERRG